MKAGDVTFFGDVAVLRERPDETPRTHLLARLHAVAGDVSLGEAAVGRTGERMVSLYPIDASVRSRPVVQFFVAGDTPLDALAEEIGPVDVLGWPEPGRAVLIRGHAVELLSLTPCRKPFLGRRFGNGATA